MVQSVHVLKRAGILRSTSMLRSAVKLPSTDMFQHTGMHNFKSTNMFQSIGLLQSTDVSYTLIYQIGISFAFDKMLGVLSKFKARNIFKYLS